MDRRTQRLENDLENAHSYFAKALKRAVWIFLGFSILGLLITYVLSLDALQGFLLVFGAMAIGYFLGVPRARKAARAYEEVKDASGE